MNQAAVLQGVKIKAERTPTEYSFLIFYQDVGEFVVGLHRFIIPPVFIYMCLQGLMSGSLSLSSSDGGSYLIGEPALSPTYYPLPISTHVHINTNRTGMGMGYSRFGICLLGIVSGGSALSLQPKEVDIDGLLVKLQNSLSVLWVIGFLVYLPLLFHFGKSRIENYADGPSSVMSACGLFVLCKALVSGYLFYALGFHARYEKGGSIVYMKGASAGKAKSNPLFSPGAKSKEKVKGEKESNKKPAKVLKVKDGSAQKDRAPSDLKGETRNAAAKSLFRRKPAKSGSEE
jgi:hypothetical protein